MPTKRGSGSKTANPRRAEAPAGQAITIIPGRYVERSKLEDLLNGKFGGKYAVEVRRRMKHSAPLLFFT